MALVKIYEEGTSTPRSFEADQVFFINGQTHGLPERLMEFASRSAEQVDGTLFVNPDALLAVEISG